MTTSEPHRPHPDHEAGDEAAGQPVWQRDFPIPAAGEEEITRREFVRYLALGSGGLAVASLGLAAWTSLNEAPAREPKEIAPLADIPVGSERLFRYPTEHDPAILVRPAEDDLRAFSQRCTHLACVVVWEADADQFACPCHHGYFDATDGRVLAGPPERPLNRIALEVRDGVVWAVGGGGH